jgi:hypothetical protein
LKEAKDFRLRQEGELSHERVFRGRTLLGNHRLAGRYAEFGTCDFNDLQKR